MNREKIDKELRCALVQLEESGDIVITTPSMHVLVDKIREAIQVVVDNEGRGNRNERINRELSLVVKYLQEYFRHSEEYARRITDEFHARYENTRGWADDDYYAHEGPQSIALEVHYFIHLANEPYEHNLRYLNWRKKFYEATRT